MCEESGERAFGADRRAAMLRAEDEETGDELADRIRAIRAAALELHDVPLRCEFLGLMDAALASLREAGRPRALDG